MPIPKPTAAETQNDYMGRCMNEIKVSMNKTKQWLFVFLLMKEKNLVNKSFQIYKVEYNLN